MTVVAAVVNWAGQLAAIGAGIGSLIGGPAGTLLGGEIGGLIGGVIETCEGKKGKT